MRPMEGSEKAVEPQGTAGSHWRPRRRRGASACVDRGGQFDTCRGRGAGRVAEPSGHISQPEAAEVADEAGHRKEGSDQT